MHIDTFLYACLGLFLLVALGVPAASLVLLRRERARLGERAAPVSLGRVFLAEILLWAPAVCVVGVLLLLVVGGALLGVAASHHGPGERDPGANAVTALVIFLALCIIAPLVSVGLRLHARASSKLVAEGAGARHILAPRGGDAL